MQPQLAEVCHVHLEQDFRVNPIPLQRRCNTAKLDPDGCVVSRTGHPAMSSAVVIICAALWAGLVGVCRAESTATTEIPPVAIHVSEATAALWNKLGGPHAEWKYWHTWGFLMEAFHGDGTPYVRITDEAIQQGKLFQNGRPAFPIVFSLASACIADRTAAQFERYIRAGGHAYVGSTAWTRNEYDDPRTFHEKARFAVAGMGLAPRGVMRIGTARKVADDPLVAQFKPSGPVNWLLPRSADSIGWAHPEHWIERVTSEGAHVLLESTGNILLAVQPLGRGRIIYHSEFCPLAGYSGYVVDNLEYSFFRNAVDEAYRAMNLPLVRLATWPYPSVAAFKTRHDHFLHKGASDFEARHGIRGEWLLRTNEAIGSGDWRHLSAIRKNGALIGSHTLDEYTLDSGSYEAARDNVRKSLDDLKGHLGERPRLFVAPGMMAFRDSSIRALVDNGLVTTGDISHGPFPSFALKIDTADDFGPDAHWPILEIPVSRYPARAHEAWGNLIYSHMEDMSLETIRDTVDLSYALGGVINVYDHVGDPAPFIRARWPYPTTEHFEFYLKYALQKPRVWKTDPLAILAWWTQRERSKVAYARALTKGRRKSVQVGVEDSEGSPVAIDVLLPPAMRAAKVLGSGAEPVEHVLGETTVKIKVPPSGTIVLELEPK